jgi:glycosyltransferase involved in cell wall biosynthesis
VTGGPARPRPRRRVVYLDHTASLSGGELALVRLLGALDDVDARVVLAEPGPLEDELRAAGAAVVVLPLGESTRGLGRESVTARRLPWRSAAATLAYVWRTARVLRRERPDLVHTNSLKAGVYGSLAARLARTPVVWQVHDRIADDYLPGPAVRLVRALLAVVPDAVVPNSEATASTLGRARRRRQVRAVVPPAVAAPDVPSGARGPHPLRVGVVGRLAPWKGQDVALRAFAAAFPDGVEQLALVGAPLFGEDDFEARLHELADELGIASRVEFRGHRSELGGELARLDILVHSSVIPEPFGQVVVEGMAAGLPVVAADAGGPAEIVTPAIDGLLYPPGDVDALASELRRLAADPELRAALGAAGPATARRYAPDAVAAQMRAVYDAVLANAARSDPSS